MSNGITQLTEKEKDTLRLIVRGHDAKSCARELGLSVHTINERLRAARRKLDVTSSREAARILLEHEAGTDNNLGYEGLGDAPPSPSPHHPSTVNPGRRKALLFGGILMISTLALFVSITLSGVAPEADLKTASGDTAHAGDMHESADAEREAAARAWLALVDNSDWQSSYDKAGKTFREPNTVKTWRDASQEARVPLGKVLSRKVIGIQLVASPQAYEVVQFASTFENKAKVTESVTLERENGELRVVGYFIS